MQLALSYTFQKSVSTEDRNYVNRSYNTTIGVNDIVMFLLLSDLLSACPYKNIEHPPLPISPDNELLIVVIIICH